MNVLEARPGTESSVVIPFRGYSEDKENMLFLQEVLNLKSPSIAPRVAMRIVKAMILSIDGNQILSEFHRRVTVNNVNKRIQRGENVIPEPQTVYNGSGRKAT